MSKKSSKTSHVLNLLTNRTGAVIDGEADQAQSQSAPADGESGGGASIGDSASGEPGGSASAGREPGGENTSASGFSGEASLSNGSPSGGSVGLPNPFLVEIAAPVRIAVSNPVIAELTGETALHRASSAFSEETPQKKPEEKAERKNPSVTDLIRMELERNYHREQQVPQQEEQAFSKKAPTPEAKQQMPQIPEAEQETLPPQTPEAEQAYPAEEGLTPPHIEEFTPDEFAEPDEGDALENASEVKTAAAAENADEAKTTAAAAENADEAKTTAAAAENADETEAVFQPCYINVMDEIVRSNVLPIMESLEMCTCSRCVNDVVALALNLLPPKYVVTEKGSLYAKVSLYEGQHKVDVLSSITKACLEVNRNPRHHLAH